MVIIGLASASPDGFKNYLSKQDREHGYHGTQASWLGRIFQVLARSIA